MTGFSNNLPPSGSKAYLYAYLQGANWYKAQLVTIPQTLTAPQPTQQAQKQQSQAQAQSSAQNTPPQGQTRTGRVHIEGEIVNTNPQDKSFSVRTPEGLVAIKLAATAALPPEGLRIEIEIPRAREGQQIAFRPLPREQQTSAIRQNIPRDIMPPPASPAPTSNQRVPPSRATTPIIDNAIDPPPQILTTAQNGQAESPATASPVIPPLPVLQKGAIVTLTPLPPENVANIVPLPQTITIPQAADTKADTRHNAPQAPISPTEHTAQPPAPPINFAAQILQHKIGTALQIIAQSEALDMSETLIQTIKAKTEIIATQINLQQIKQAETTLALQNNPSASAASQQPPPQIVRIDDIILPQTAGKNTAPQAQSPTQPPPIAQTAQTVTTTPQAAQFIGQLPDGRPVIEMQPPPQTAPPATSGQNQNPSADQPVSRYFTANIAPAAVAQNTTITFSSAPEVVIRPDTATPQPPLQKATPQQTAAAITPEAAMAGIQPFSFPLTGASDTWPALDDITKTLQQTAPQAAQTLMLQSPNIANPAMKMEPAILFFLIAARSGDIASWLGDKATSLLRGAGKDNAIHKILHDFTSLSHASREAGSNAVTPEWRSMPVPLFAYNEAHKIMLHYKYDDDSTSDDTDKRKKSMRFLIDLDLNRMGDVQLDGFAQSGRLDLIVRTHQSLSPAMQQIMRRKYSDSLEYTGFHGELGFQQQSDQFIKLEAVAAPQEGMNI